MTKRTRTTALPDDWNSYLSGEFDKPYMEDIRNFLRDVISSGKKVYPVSDEIFNAFYLTSFSKVKVVILGQDPYHGPGQAHGLSFSVRNGIAIPPSLRNIFKEIERDFGISSGDQGCLEDWARQGVLLLNSVLTVNHGEAGSHQGKGWEIFTDKVIEVLNLQKNGLVFLLWGANAIKKAAMIDSNRHLVLQSAHPSPLSAHRGFIGNGHFSTTNNYLVSQNQLPVNWIV